MADSLEFKLEGLAQLEAKLVELGGAGARRSVRKGLRQMANVVLEDARARAPVDTGLLKKSIYTRDTGQTPSGWSFAVDVRQKAFYGKFIEYGTSKMAAKPFLRPAAETKAFAAGEAFAAATAAAIELEASK